MHHAAAAGLPILPVQSFSRPVALDGGTQDARFRTTRLDPAKIAMGRVYFCEHQTPDLVWRPEWQSHPNGACAIARVVVATADPRRTARLFRGLFGDDAVTERDGRQMIDAGTAQVLSSPRRMRYRPNSARRRQIRPAAPNIWRRWNQGPVAAETAEQCLRSVPGLRVEPHRLVVPAGAAFNTAIAFSE